MGRVACRCSISVTLAEQTFYFKCVFLKKILSRFLPLSTADIIGGAIDRFVARVITAARIVRPPAGNRQRATVSSHVWHAVESNSHVLKEYRQRWKKLGEQRQERFVTSHRGSSCSWRKHLFSRVSGDDDVGNCVRTNQAPTWLANYRFCQDRHQLPTDGKLFPVASYLLPRNRITRYIKEIHRWESSIEQRKLGQRIAFQSRFDPPTNQPTYFHTMETGTLAKNY